MLPAADHHLSAGAIGENALAGRPAHRDDVGVTELFGVRPDTPWPSVAILGYMEDDSTLAMGFASAADLIVDDWERGARDDSMAVPMMYLYRHAMELALKQSVRDVATRLRAAKDAELGHSLAALAGELQRLLARLNIQTLPDEVMATLDALHKSDATGEAFRYSLHRESGGFAQTRPEQLRVDIVALRARLRESFGIIVYGLSGVLEAHDDYRAELLSYAEDLSGEY